MKSLSKISEQGTKLPEAFRQQEEKPTAQNVKNFWAPAEKTPSVAEARPYTFSDLEDRPGAVGEAAPMALPEESQPPSAPSPVPMDVPAIPTYQDEARNEAQLILQAARADANALRQQALQEGREEGYKVGYAEGTEAAQKEQEEILHGKVEAALHVVAQALHQIDVEKQKQLENNLDDLRELTLAIAEKVINVSLKSSGDIVERMIVAATERSKNQAWAKINVSGYDAEVMMQGDMSIISAMQNISPNVKIVAMDNAERGDCIIEFPDQIIDAGVKTQLENIKEIMRAGENG